LGKVATFNFLPKDSIMPMFAPSRLSRPANLLATILVIGSTLFMHPAKAEGWFDGMLKINIGNYSRTSFDTATGSVLFKSNGKIRFNEAEDDVSSVDGKLSIEEKRKGQVLRMEFSSDGTNGITRRYTVDGKERAADAETQRWLAGVIPPFLRENAIGVATRIEKIRQKGGVDAVLAEIDKIQADFARRKYISTLAAAGQLSEPQVTRLLAAAGKLDGDFESRSALAAIVKHQNLNAEQQVNLLAAVGKIDSDFEKRCVLTDLATKLASEPAVLKAWQHVVQKVDSDFERRVVIGALAGREHVTPEQIEAGLQASQSIDSDFERRVVLTTLAKKMAEPTPAQVGGYLKSAQKINSDFERRVVLLAFLKNNKLGKADYNQLFDAMNGMGSDFEMRTVLQATAKSMPKDADLIGRYRQVARGMGDFERGQAEKALDRFN
jgi:hypothetical protein